MSKQTTCPARSDGSRFTALPLLKTNGGRSRHHKSSFWKHSTRTESTSSSSRYDFSDLPQELVAKIGASLSYHSLKTASLVCRSWCEALRPAREATKFLTWGKQFKHGRGDFKPNVNNALKMFLKAAELGSTKAMVDAGLIFWERGDKDKAFGLYREAAEAGDRNAQGNLGMWYLQVEPPNPKEAVKWLYLASFQGHVRAQYQLAICLYQGRGADRNMKEAEHLSCEHFGAFLANVKELNAREQRKEVKVAEATKSNAEAMQSNAVVATDCDTTTDIIHEKVPNGRKCRSHRRRKSRV